MGSINQRKIQYEGLTAYADSFWKLNDDRVVLLDTFAKLPKGYNLIMEPIESDLEEKE